MPIRKDREGRWHAEACVGRRRLHRRLPVGSTASDAKRIEAELVRALHLQATVRAVQIPGDPLLTDLLADYTERHALNLRSTDTAQYHAYRIGRWCEGRRASETREVAAAIVQDLTGHYAPATINRSLGALKKALRMAWERGRVPVDYSGLVKRLAENNQKTAVLTIEQVRSLADAASEPVRAAIWIGLLTGCRRGEVCKIKAEDIGADVIRIEAGNTKTLRKGNFKDEFGIDAECYVLDDSSKTAVITQLGMGEILGLGSGGSRLPRFVFNKTMSQFVGPDLRQKLEKPLVFHIVTAGQTSTTTTKANGYDATVLIDVCQAILKAKAAGNQINPAVVAQAGIIVGASAKAGIQGLVYALTGFDRTKEEVIQAFRHYVREEAKKYEQEFPNELYMQWHRLYEIRHDLHDLNDNGEGDRSVWRI